MNSASQLQGVERLEQAIRRLAQHVERGWHFVYPSRSQSRGYPSTTIVLGIKCLQGWKGRSNEGQTRANPKGDDAESKSHCNIERLGDDTMPNIRVE